MLFFVTWGLSPTETLKTCQSQLWLSRVVKVNVSKVANMSIESTKEPSVGLMGRISDGMLNIAAARVTG